MKKILSRKGRSRDDYSDGDLAMLRRHGFDKWVRAVRSAGRMKTRRSNPRRSVVWKRAPHVREDGELTELAVRWSEMNRSGRTRILDMIDAVEQKTRELTTGERRNQLLRNHGLPAEPAVRPLISAKPSR